MTYKALTRFADLMDGGRIYEAGDNYPRFGLDVTQERLNLLAGSDNRAGKPLITAVEAPEATHAVERTETAIERDEAEAREIPAEAVKPARKPRRSRQKG